MAQPPSSTVILYNSLGAPTATFSLTYVSSEGTIAQTQTGGIIYSTPAPNDDTSSTISSGPASSGVAQASTPPSTPGGDASPTSAAAVNPSPLVGSTPSTSAASVTPSLKSTTSDNSPSTIHTPSSTTPSKLTSSSPNIQTTRGSSTPSPHRLANGTVAGIVIGVAIGLALITFLATFLAIRRRGGSRGKRYRQRSDTDGGLSGSARHQTLSSEPKQPLVTQTSNGSTTFDDFLPQSADDKTVQNNVKTVLDQIELHVENFYQNSQASGSRLAEPELAMFDSPYLPSSLASLLPQTNNRILLIKHALAHFITACITTPSDTNWSLLPKDFLLVPNAVRTGGSTKPVKPGFTQSMSRWRTLTAYLRPSTLDDTAYIAQREHQINIIVQNFSTAFAPWQSPRYKDEERVRSLVAILKEAADIGIWLFSQPSELQFQWPKYNDIGSSRIAVAPALVKITDERGQTLGKPQVMIDMTAKKV